jgi:hypothetical protein
MERFLLIPKAEVALAAETLSAIRQEEEGQVVPAGFLAARIVEMLTPLVSDFVDGLPGRYGEPAVKAALFGGLTHE